MSIEKSLLEEITIKNFLSLREVCLPLKPLTVLVGPNSSGKSNILRALGLLRTMIIAPEPPPAEYIEERTWIGGADNISYQLKANINDTLARYTLELSSQSENRVSVEELTIDQINVIQVRNGVGQVRDEKDTTQVTLYKPTKPKIALTSAGDYGDKPITSALTEFIQGWAFYNFKPEEIRNGASIVNFIKSIPNLSTDLQGSIGLDNEGSILGPLLAEWYENDLDRFKIVNEALENCAKLKLGQQGADGHRELGLLEGYDELIPLERASDGTLRLIAYQVLLNQLEVPSLIAIEEPERNLHPAALKYVASFLEMLARRTQVIITTHSSQLLDAFSPENLSKDLGVLLLQNIPGKGTEVINLEKIRSQKSSLDGWIEDFGIGSAIFDSALV